MRTPAEAASANAISLELKKDGLQQRQNGDWMLRFTVAGVDMHQRLATAVMGTRYQCVLVEVGDDEEPIDHNAMERDKWRDLGPVTQAGMRCADPVFWAWLEEEGPKGQPHECKSNDDAAVIVRMLCNVASRADLAKPGFQNERIRWYDIDNAFQAWRRKENA
jgi:hypothetical protein